MKKYYKTLDSEGNIKHVSRLDGANVKPLITDVNDKEPNEDLHWKPSNVTEWAEFLNPENPQEFLNSEEYTEEEKQAIQSLT